MTRSTPQPYRLLTAGALTAALAASPALAANNTLDTSAARLITTAAAAQPEEAPELADNSSFFSLSGWEGSFSLGMNGASGNNENFNARAGMDAHKETDRNEATFGLAYTYATSDGTQSANRFAANARYDWLLPDSKWRFFVIGSYEYDEFQDWDHRVTIGPGVGYQAIKTEDTDLLLRFAVLGTREFGGSDDKWIAELNPGLDFEHKINERQTFVSTLDFYSNLDDTNNYRFVGSAAWRIEMDPEAGLFLELGVEDRYDSNPGPSFKKNDFAYFATVGWSF